jgi:O-antigen/teichoic acid export membrane protein
VSARARLLRIFASNSFGLAVTMVIQFGTVPILLAAWGPALYGEWLLATTIPGYLAMSDLGLGTALANDMALSAARGDRQGVIGAFQSVGWTIFAIGPLVLLPIAVLIAIFPLGPAFGMSSITGADLGTLMTLLLAQVWLGQQHGVLQAGFRSADYLVFPNLSWQFVRIAEFAALAVIAISGYGPIAVVAAMVVLRIIAAAGIIVVLRILVPWLTFGIAQAELATVRRLLRPAVMFLAFPLANALNLQTPLLVVGAVLGPEATVAFSTARTISRAIQQLPSMINASVWPMISQAFGAGDMSRVRRLFRFAVAISIWISAAGVVALALIGPSLYQFWTHRLIRLDPVLLDLLLICVFVNALWYTASVLFTSTNRHAEFAKCSVVVNLVVVPLCWVLAELAGLRGVAGGLILGEIMIALYVWPAATRLAGDRLVELARFLVSPAELIRLLHPGSPIKRHL